MIKTGDTYCHNLQFTQEDVNTFARITGDNNPIHIDEAFASTTVFGRPIVHGFLSGAVFSKVFGTLFPGEGTIYMYQEMKFTGPVFVNQPYTAIFQVSEVNTEKHTGLIQCRLQNAEGKDCIIGSAKLKNDRQFI